MRWKRVQGTQYVLRTLWNVFLCLEASLTPAFPSQSPYPTCQHDSLFVLLYFWCSDNHFFAFLLAFFLEQNVSLLKWLAKKTGKFRLNTIVYYCDWLCSLKSSQSYKMCSLLGLEHLLEWIFNMPVEKPEEISSHLPIVNLGLKRNKIVTACSGLKKNNQILCISSHK